MRLACIPDGALDAIGGSLKIIMRPDNDQTPSCIRERCLIATVAGDISFELWQPVVEIRLGQHRMVGA